MSDTPDEHERPSDAPDGAMAGDAGRVSRLASEFQRRCWPGGMFEQQGIETRVAFLAGMAVGLRQVKRQRTECGNHDLTEFIEELLAEVLANLEAGPVETAPVLKILAPKGDELTAENPEKGK